MLIFSRGVNIMFSNIQEGDTNSALLTAHRIDAACDQCNLFLFHCTTRIELFNVA